MTTSLRDLTVAQLNKAVTIKEQIEQLEKELTSIFGGSETAADTTPSSGRRTMSAAGRVKISAAAKARWAKVNAGKPIVAAPTKGKRTMSAAARAKISAAAKARWARVRAGKK